MYSSKLGWLLTLALVGVLGCPDGDGPTSSSDVGQSDGASDIGTEDLAADQGGADATSADTTSSDSNASDVGPDAGPDLVVTDTGVEDTAPDTATTGDVMDEATVTPEDITVLLLSAMDQPRSEETVFFYPASGGAPVEAISNSEGVAVFEAQTESGTLLTARGDDDGRLFDLGCPATTRRRRISTSWTTDLYAFPLYYSGCESKSDGSGYGLVTMGGIVSRLLGLNPRRLRAVDLTDSGSTPRRDHDGGYDRRLQSLDDQSVHHRSGDDTCAPDRA